MSLTHLDLALAKLLPSICDLLPPSLAYLSITTSLRLKSEAAFPLLSLPPSLTHLDLDYPPFVFFPVENFASLCKGFDGEPRVANVKLNLPNMKFLRVSQVFSCVLICIWKSLSISKMDHFCIEKVFLPTPPDGRDILSTYVCNESLVTSIMYGNIQHPDRLSTHRAHYKFYSKGSAWHIVPSAGLIQLDGIKGNKIQRFASKNLHFYKHQS